MIEWEALAFLALIVIALITHNYVSKVRHEVFRIGERLDAIERQVSEIVAESRIRAAASAEASSARADEIADRKTSAA